MNFNRNHRPEPMLEGGTEVDDEVMSLVRLSELAADDAEARRDIIEISELISTSLCHALEKESGETNEQG